MAVFTSQWSELRTVPAKNWCDEEIPPFSLCPIIGSRVNEHGYLVYKLGKTGTTFYRQYLMTGPQPMLVTINSAGWHGCGNGYCGGNDLRFAYDPSASPAFGEGFGPKPGEFAAFKGYPSLLTVGDAFEADLKWAFGQFTGEITTLLCKTTAAVSAGALATDGSEYVIWQGTMADGDDAGFTTVPEIEIGVDIDSGKFFHASWTNGGWVGGPLQCNGG